MATLKKIKVQFFWADESVWMEDNRKKISKGMVDWANKFYEHYGFVFDVLPKSIDTLAKAKPYCLAKSDGIQPEMGFYDRILEERNKEIAVFEAKIKKIEDELKVMESKRAELQAESKALDVEYDALPSTSHAARAAIRERQHNLHLQVMASYEATMKKMDEDNPFQDEIFKLRDKYDKMNINNDHETKLRKVLMQKFEIDDIGDTDRVSIVFCRFKTVDPVLAMRKKKPGYGITHLRNDFYYHNGSFMWYYPFIAVNIKPDEIITIAHEIVHAAGTRHPDARKVLRDPAAFFGYKPKIMTGSIMNMVAIAYQNYIEYESFFELKDGGWFHHGSNDIMNYASKSQMPDKVVLHDDDKERLTKAYFVE
jgi:hypothetical protein